MQFHRLLLCNHCMNRKPIRICETENIFNGVDSNKHIKIKPFDTQCIKILPITIPEM